MCVKEVKLKEYFMVTQDRHLVNFTRGEVYELNTLGYEIVKSLSKNKSIEEIINQIVEKYNVSSEKVEEDVMKFLQILQDEGIVEVIENEG